MTTYPVAEDALTTRLTATDVETLERAGAAFAAAADEVDAHLARRRAIRGACSTGWTGRSAETAATAFDDADRVLRSLPGALRGIGDALRRHARVTRDAQDEVRRASLATFRVPAAPQGVELAAAVERATADFHRSEIVTRSALWDIGSRAPGGMRLPLQPHGVMLPPNHRWQVQSYPEFWTWRDPDDPPAIGEPAGPLATAWDPRDPVNGLDEDLRAVPAYAATIPYPVEPPDEVGAPIGPLLRRLALLADRAAPAAGSSTRALAATEDELRAVVTSSSKWSTGRVDKHVREWFHLGRADDIEPWMRKEYLDLIVRTGARNGRPFRWSLPPSEAAGGTGETIAVLGRDPLTGRMLVQQYWASGPNAGRFATAFEPNPAQYTAMLRAPSLP